MTNAHIKRVKTEPKGESNIFFKKSPSMAVGIASKNEVTIPFTQAGFSGHFLYSNTILSIEVKQKINENPTSREYTPITAGKNHIEINIKTELIIKNSKVFFSKPIELSILVVMLEILINSIRKADAVR